MVNPSARTTTELMQAFSQNASPGAFRALVDRYFPVVYSAALQRSGNPAIADEVAQLVFTDFAVRAPSLRADDRIGAWLHRAATFRTGDLMKSERRRKRREQLAAERMELDRLPEFDAWSELRPVVDESINRLRARDREALILRFYEEHSLAEVGAALGVSADAAQKRVERALGRLRSILTERGVSAGVAVLGTVLGCRPEAAAAIPSALAGKVSTSALHVLAAGGPAAWWYRFGLVPNYFVAAMSVTLLVGTVPLVAKWQQSSSTQATSHNGSSRDLNEPATRVPAADELPQIAEPTTVDEIVNALGLLLARPLTSLDRARCSVLFNRIPPAQAGRALALMDARWPATSIRRAENETSIWRSNLALRWSHRNPRAALAWYLKSVEPGSPTYLVRTSVNYRVSEILRNWSKRDWDSAWEWTLAGLADGSLLKKDQYYDFAVEVVRGLEEGLAEHVGIKESIDLMVGLKSATGLGGLSAKVETFDDFVYFMESASTFPDPEKRRDLRRGMASACPSEHWGAALEWIKQTPSDMERADLAWALGFPRLSKPLPSTSIPLERFSDHADWLLSLDPLRSSDSRKKFRHITDWWLRYDPKAATDWILRHEFHPLPRAMRNILQAVPRVDEKIYRTGPLAPVDEWKAHVARLFRKWRDLDPDLYKSVVIDRGEREFIAEQEIAAFLEEYQLGEVTE